jgi:3-hydroxyacyl-CoA dehydrogenase
MSQGRFTVLGCAPLAVSIALTLHRAGKAVRVVETDPNAAERAVHAMRDNGAELARLLVSHFDDAIEGTLILSEGEIEEADLKTAADRVGTETAVLALGSAVEAGSMFDTGRWVGLHLFEPVHLRHLAEIEPQAETGEAAIRAAQDLVGLLKKEPLVLAPGKGSAALRMLDRLIEAADTLMMDGSTPWEIDEAMVDFGFDMGLYEAQDLAGLDVAYMRRQNQAHLRNPARRYIPIADRAVREGRLGKKIGWGWYRYPGGGGAVIDPLVEDLAREEAWFAGVTPTPVTDIEIVNRLMLALVNEGAFLISDGVLPDWGSVDLIAVHALGFPQARGGPGRILQEKGRKAILAELQGLCEEDPVSWAPAPLLLANG